MAILYQYKLILLTVFWVTKPENPSLYRFEVTESVNDIIGG